MATNSRVLDVDGLQALIDELRKRGFTVIGPTIRDGAIVNGPVASIDDLPRGVGDDQEAGRYGLRQRGDDAFFGYAAAATSMKSVLFPADELIWKGKRDAAGAFAVEAGAKPDGPPYALLGVRSCDLRAIEIHDKVLSGRAFVDAHYGERRAGAFVVSVTCGDPGGTCFCASVGTGPAPTSGYDLSLTELLTRDSHTFVVKIGSETGADVMDAIKAPKADEVAHCAAAEDVAKAAILKMGRELDTDGLKYLMYASADSPHWDEVAERCLACTNCTMVCPTCFCTSVEDVRDLSGNEAERHRVWDSCFSQEFSYIHGGSVRDSVRSRYRQWITHKLAAWEDQFGMLGCVGCGRCITWCPAAIDITAEAAALRGVPSMARK